MKKFDIMELQNLRWVQPSFWSRRYELQNESGEVLAIITRQGIFGQQAEAEALGNHWLFERKGVFRRKIYIQSIGTGESPAHFVYRFNEGKLEFRFDETVYWKRGNFFGSLWQWKTADGQPLVSFKMVGLLRLGCEVTIAPGAEEYTALPLLLLLGWYLCVLGYEDRAAATAAAS
jgi:hypothetical protein